MPILEAFWILFHVEFFGTIVFLVGALGLVLWMGTTAESVRKTGEEIRRNFDLDNKG